MVFYLTEETSVCEEAEVKRHRNGECVLGCCLLLPFRNKHIEINRLKAFSVFICNPALNRVLFCENHSV